MSVGTSEHTLGLWRLRSGHMVGDLSISLTVGIIMSASPAKICSEIIDMQRLVLNMMGQDS